MILMHFLQRNSNYFFFFLQIIRKMTDGGVDYSFECTGNGNVLRDAFLAAHAVYGYVQAIFSNIYLWF